MKCIHRCGTMYNQKICCYACYKNKECNWTCLQYDHKVGYDKCPVVFKGIPVIKGGNK